MSESTIHVLLDNMWQDYLKLNPEANRIYTLLADANHGHIINDHIALRTFNLDRVCIEKIARPFVEAGYVERGDYHFAAKKLDAVHYEHPDADLPKVFVSELQVEKLSTEAQATINYLLEQLDDEAISDDHFCYSGRPWQVDSETYTKLLAESEYAAWMAAFGYRPNHFTIFVNALRSHGSLLELNKFLIENDIVLNHSGGVIKGSPSQGLEQSSTLANKIQVQFSDKELLVPSCYYEFAYRHPKTKGENDLYQGFIASSADKIFESTDVVQQA